MATQRLTRHERRKLERVAARAWRGQSYIDPMLEAGLAAPAGSVSIVEVSHDDWCPKLHGGLCRCEPDIVTREVR